jgi:SNF2 family DNA or RNA helicase
MPIGELRIDAAEINYIVAGIRVSDSLRENILLAPIESSVIPLPHQIVTLLKAVSADRVRLLLADEVGLGKTIEAGLILKELKLRGLVRRVLVVAPKGIVTQWVAEMRTHFGEQFRLLIPSDFPAFRRVAAQDNVWKTYDQVVCPLDSVKPIERRRGWSKEQVAEYNRDRYQDLLAADWDLIIIDEAHRLGGTTEQVARYKLGIGLAEAAPYLLLLSATPHQGKSDAFYRLISLLDKAAFPDAASVKRERLEPYLARTEKRRAIDAEGNPLFKPRRTQLLGVAWNDRHALQKKLYESVSEYVQLGYNQALREKKVYLGFLLLLMQRLVTSSTNAIRATLERRLEVLHASDEQMTLFPIGLEEEWADMDGQEQVDALLKIRIKALGNEKREVEALLELARHAESAGPDAKAETLLDLIYDLQRSEDDPELKILVFTEFVPTQEMLRSFLEHRGFNVACLNGGMEMEAREEVLKRFAGDVRILVSTDAGGEGLNLQFCHVVINYDIPWNPMRLEQRIGRVDRIGQAHTVRAVNFVLQDTVEYQVRDVLEQKLEVILHEFGVDKTGDVLDSADAGEIFDDLYRDAVLNPASVVSQVDSALAKVRAQAETLRANKAMLAQTVALTPAESQRLLGHPLPYWIERMTVNYLRSAGGGAEHIKSGWDLTWPDGYRVSPAVFTLRDAERSSAATHLTLEMARVRGITMAIPRFVPGQAVPCVQLDSIGLEVRGTWSLWTVEANGPDYSRERALSLFLHDDGRVLHPTARHIWEALLDQNPVPSDYMGHIESERIIAESRPIADEQGRAVYDEMAQLYADRLRREQENKEYSFSARRRSIEKIGLTAVRQHRLADLVREEADWRKAFAAKRDLQPEIVPRLVLRIEGTGQDG